MKTLFLSISAKVGDKKKRRRIQQQVQRKSEPAKLTDEHLDQAEAKVKEQYAERRKAVLEKRRGRAYAKRRERLLERRKARKDESDRKRTEEKFRSEAPERERQFKEREARRAAADKRAKKEQEDKAKAAEERKKEIAKQMARLKARQEGRPDPHPPKESRIPGPKPGDPAKEPTKPAPAPPTPPAPKKAPESPKKAPPEPVEEEEEAEEEPKKKEKEKEKPDGWWDQLDARQQKAYLEAHPTSKLKVRTDDPQEDEEAEEPPENAKAKKKRLRKEAAAKVRESLDKVSPENMQKFADDLRDLQTGKKTLGKKAANTLAKLASAAITGAMAATSFMSPFPEFSRVAGAITVYQLTGARIIGLPNYWTSPSVQKFFGGQQDTGFKMDPDDYDDPEKFKEQLADHIAGAQEELLDPRLLQLMKKHAKTSD